MIDFTRGNCLKQMVRFSIPLFIGNLFQQLYTVVDSILLGKLVSPQALAASGTVTPVSTLLVSIVGGFTLGTSLVAAVLKGQKNEEGIRRLIQSTFLVDMLIGIVLSAGFFILAKPMLTLMQTPSEVLEQAVVYMRIIAIGLIFQCLYQYMTDVLRGLGDSRTPLLFLIVSTILNIVLDTAFIVVFHMKVAGVAWATVIAQVVAAVCCMFYSLHKYECFRVSLKISLIDRELLMRSLRLGLPSAMQYTVSSVSAIALQSLINSFGTAAMNGYNAAYKVDNFIMLPLMNMCMALGNFVAQNVGAGQMNRVKEGLQKTSVACGSVCAALSLIIFVCAEKFVLLFVTADQIETIQIGARGLRILAVFFFLCSQHNVFVSFFKGVGAVHVSFWSSFGQVLIRLPLTFVLAKALWMDAVWFSMTGTWVVLCTFDFWYYRSGRWRKSLKHMVSASE